jgi:serralysin
VQVLFLRLGNQHPVITSSAMVSVPENTAAVMNVTASDVDVPPQSVAFSIVGGADEARFSITSGGLLSFNTPPNFEAPTDVNGNNVYEVTVRAGDGNGGADTQMISVTVTPVNDNSPVITSLDTVSVPENSTSVLSLTATDADLPPQLITYSIVGGPDQARFNITSGGALSFKTPPDFEAPSDTNGDNVYVAVIQASDGTYTTFQAILVTVTPINDQNPVFTSPTAVNVPENSTAAMTVTATDPDLPPQTIAFSLVGGADQSKFNITSGGALSFVAPPNFEVPSDANGDNVYVVVVQASDGGLTTVQAILVTVTPVNDINPVFTSTNTASVPENTTFVKSVTATDVDVPAQSVTFSIAGGADQSKFIITTGGLLSFAAPPDFEVPTDANGDNVYVVTVQASDGAGGSTTQTINVAVTPINDSNPVITSADTVSVPENTTAILTVTATDADQPPQAIVFSIIGGTDQAKFGITSGGVLSFTSAPDFEAPTDSNGDNTYVVIVQASDGTLTNLQAILVTVTNVIEPVPGDYNNNGVVDVADYVVWRNGGPLQNEGMTPGLVTPEDYDVWRANFGRTQQGTGGSASISAEAVSTAANSLDGDVTFAEQPAESTSTGQPRLHVAGLTQVPIQRTNGFQLPRREALATSTSKERALIAWLATRSAYSPRDQYGTFVEDRFSKPDVDPNSHATVDALDLAFAIL